MATPKILVFQHVPYEPLGTLDPLLKEAGFRIRYVNFDPDASRAHVHSHIDNLESQSRRTFSRWLEQFDFGKRRRTLPSR